MKALTRKVGAAGQKKSRATDLAFFMFRLRHPGDACVDHHGRMAPVCEGRQGRRGRYGKEE